MSRATARPSNMDRRRARLGPSTSFSARSLMLAHRTGLPTPPKRYLADPCRLRTDMGPFSRTRRKEAPRGRIRNKEGRVPQPRASNLS